MSTNSVSKLKFLPDGASDYLRRRATEAWGLALIITALVLALAFLSFSVDDPSANHATAGPVFNYLGVPGAWVADIVLQTIGLAAGLISLTLLAWGWRMISHRGLPLLWLNMSTLPVMLVGAAFVLAAFSVPQNWPLASGLGGWVGDGLFRSVVSLGQEAGLPLSPGLYGLIAAPVVLILIGIAFALSPSEWRALSFGAWRSVRRTQDVVGSLGRAKDKAGELLDRRGGKDKEDGVIARKLKERIRREPSLEKEKRSEPRLSTEAPAARTGLKITPPKRRVDTAKKSKSKNSKRADDERQPSLDLESSGNTGEIQLPELSLLAEAKGPTLADTISEDALEQNARLLESVLEDFGVRGEITKVRPGPVVTLYELEPAPGTKTSRVIGLSDDIARSMSTISVRVSVVPGRNAIGIEMPNVEHETVYLRELLSSEDYENTSTKLSLALGKDIGGMPVIADLARMPHLLIAGTTGSGKSVGVNSMILSLIYRLPPEKCRLILIDPKMLELSVYNDIPHLLTPVVTEPGKAVVALKWVVREMENRYRSMSQLGVRNIDGYNQRLGDAVKDGEEIKRTVQTGFDPETGEPVYEEQSLDLSPLPFIVVVVDEMADLMLVAGKDIEAAIQRLAQMARAAGIHIIMATQRPSVDVITGTIKANFPTRISFQVTSKIDSRTILGEQGAEQLLGSGDMLFMEGGGRVRRVHGPFVSDREVEKVVKFLKKQGKPEYLDAITESPDGDDYSLIPGGGSGNSDNDALYDQAVSLVCRERRASTSFVQRHLQIGYNRAARIIEQMESEGVISGANRVGKREVLARDIDSME
ncbi:MAG: cell division protein FtsK [Alphaproteobacteria bacterium]|nr:cell division protein FtsK [Alphaproteobacteria bacterium]MBT4085036.1 cell division protein FtsK [Alphaproteobacteria bacterium]MBT4545584.1 cell division protein FtsK [Alphaproteobacteria bacterium]MBT7745411.1 cell division protein FtsK [Alphaproteobacteria bacterium]